MEGIVVVGTALMVVLDMEPEPPPPPPPPPRVTPPVLGGVAGAEIVNINPAATAPSCGWLATVTMEVPAVTISEDGTLIINTVEDT